MRNMVRARERVREAEAMPRPAMQIVVHTAETDPWYAFTRLEAEIRETDRNSLTHAGYSLRARWEFGRELLPRCVPGRGRGALKIPPALLAELAEACGVTANELRRRKEFAELYPTEEEFSTARTKFPTWNQMRQRGLRGAGPPRARPAAVRRLRAAERALRAENIAAMDEGAIAEVVATLTGLLGLFQSAQAAVGAVPADGEEAAC